MLSQVVKVVNEQGLHMRPAGLLAGEMKKFKGCAVTLKVDGKSIKATSVMQIMSAGIKCGTTVEIVCDGENEQDALNKAVEMFQTGFGE